MPGSSSWMPYAPQGLKGLDDDDGIRNHGSVLCRIGQMCKFSVLAGCPCFFGAL